VDLESERFLVNGLSHLLPEVGFIAEENTKSNRAEYNWIIDPLDGTTNFIHGIPNYSVSIALEKNNEILIGVVYEVANKELFHTYTGAKSFLNGKEICVSSNAKLEDSLIATGLPVNEFSQLEGYKKSIEYFVRNTHGIRRLGAAATDMCYVACGRFDAFFEINLKPWDVAAGSLIIKNAGGLVCDFKGGNDWLFGKNIIASSEGINKQFIEIINSSFK
jgi:myo-inositol-1(or 4)-monophosphatase